MLLEDLIAVACVAPPAGIHPEDDLGEFDAWQNSILHPLMRKVWRVGSLRLPLRAFQGWGQC